MSWILFLCLKKDMKPTILLILLFVSAGAVSCREELWESSRSRYGMPSGEAGPDAPAVPEMPAEPGEPGYYLAGLEYPPDYDWRKDPEYGTVDCRMFLIHDGVRVLEMDVGYDFCLSSDSDMSRCLEGHIFSDYSTDSETVIKKDGTELFRYPGREMITGFLMSGGDIHTLGEPREGDGWTYRINGNIYASSETGIPVTDLYVDGGFPTFGYRVHADDFYGMEGGYFIFQNGRTLRIPEPARNARIIDFRLFHNSLYILYLDEEAGASISINGENRLLELPEGSEYSSLSGFVCDDASIYAFGKVKDASGNIISLLWKDSSVCLAFSPGIDMLACYPDGDNLGAVGHQDSVPVCYFNGEYTFLPSGYSILSEDFADFSDGRYCLFLLPSDIPGKPLYVVDGVVEEVDIVNGYLFAIGTGAG